MTQISTINTKDSKPVCRPVDVTKGSVIDELFQCVVYNDDKAAFEAIFHKTFKTLCAISTKMVKKIEISEEIVDDVLFTFWKNRKSIDIRTSFLSYLIVSVRNKSLDHLRKIKGKTQTSLEKVNESINGQTIAHDSLIYEELQQQIKTAIQSLPLQCRTIFLMSRNDELTYKEIAEKLGLSIKTIDTQMGRALKHLRIEMNEWIK